MTTTTKRAAKGGEVGANGEFYEGGKFINTVAANRKREGSRKPSLRKCEIAPYVWEMQPEGKLSLYKKFAGVFGRVEDGVAVLRCSQQTLNYFDVTIEHAQSLIDLWNTGVRWV